MNDWQKLRARYGSTNQYKKRVAALPSQIEEFSNWLIDKGADVMTALAQDEILRFRLNGELGIVWCSGSGNLLAHDCALKLKSKR